MSGILETLIHKCQKTDIICSFTFEKAPTLKNKCSIDLGFLIAQVLKFTFLHFVVSLPGPARLLAKNGRNTDLNSPHLQFLQVLAIVRLITLEFSKLYELCKITKSQMTILIDFETVYSIKHWFYISKVGGYPVIKQSTKRMPVDYIKDYVQYKKS